MSYLEIMTMAGNIVPINNSPYYLDRMLQIQVSVRAFRFIAWLIGTYL